MNTFSMNIAITISHAYVPYAYTLLLSLPAHDSAKFQVYVLHRDLTDEDCNVLSSLSKLYDIHVHFICVPVSFPKHLQTLPLQRKPVSVYVCRHFCRIRLTASSIWKPT